MDRKTADVNPEEVILLAEKWQNRGNELLTANERDIQDQMMRLVQNPVDKIVLMKMIDQGFRSSDHHRVADQINRILHDHGVPHFFSSMDRFLVFMFLGIGRHFSRFLIPKMVDKIRHDSSRTIIPGEADILHEYLNKRKGEGIRINLNHLGEEILGEEEALRRLDMAMEDLRDPEIECISMKISTLCSQISAFAFEHTIAILIERLSRLYRTALENQYIRKDGDRVPKFVYLDMEEYRDLEITVEVFMRTLGQMEFKALSAGIALQAYLPDSLHIQKTLTEWARERVSNGGGPITLRIVKGANMEMEKTHAALHNWPLAPFDNKLDVDANYKRMVDYGMEPENIRAARLGIASHNVFELAYAFKLAEKKGVLNYVGFEMLEGMADTMCRVIQEEVGDVLLYAPVASKEQFINAIGYLIRRLNENTGEKNFLRHSFNLKSGSGRWDFLKRQFMASCTRQGEDIPASNRVQDRTKERFPKEMGTYHKGEFGNEPDTDWSLKANREWAKSIRERWMMGAANHNPVDVPIVVGGEEIFSGREIKEYQDPNLIPEKLVVARCAYANGGDVERAVKVAKEDPDGWRQLSCRGRHRVLSQVAMELRRSRGDLIGAAAANTGKVFTESDPEVSEAIDFSEFYPYSAQFFEDPKNVRCRGKGVGLVISPWNFPISIPCGGIAAALAAGNTVIYKPSSNSVLVAWVLCQSFWKAGISKKVLQFVPCQGDRTGIMLTNHPDVDFIIFTGSTSTGWGILRHRPDVLLAAETGGKNATIVTAMSDRDQAIKNVIHSAFSNSGQKCSATSLLILEREVYEEASFKSRLSDAARSYRTGSAWNFENKMGPLIAPPAGDLKQAISRLEDGESWLVEPETMEENPYLLTPGIKWGVQPNSFTHKRELFGPLLGVMCAKDLNDAISIAHQTGYGLTAGLESLDEREQKHWQEKMEAGNLYINRGTTGAVVLRQPFGGMKRSALGAGIKAGGPNYVSQFMDFEELGPPSSGPIQNDAPMLQLVQQWRQKLYWGRLGEYKADLEKTVQAIMSYLFWAEQEFFREKDYFHIRGQDNIFRYRPVGSIVVRVHHQDSLFDTLARIAAARIARCELILSVPPHMENSVMEFLEGVEGEQILGNTPIFHHSESDLVMTMEKVQRIRYAAPDRVPNWVFEKAADMGFYISRERVLMEGRIELLRYFREQSICSNYHRYGNLGGRDLEQ